METEGIERSALIVFPQFFYSPAIISSVSASASVCEALVEMARRKLSGITVTTGASDQEMKLLSVNSFRDLFPATFSNLNGTDCEPGPLFRSVTENGETLSPACVVCPDSSISKVIREMVDKRTRRVIIQRRDGLTVGAVRASDILLLLLRAQHWSLAPN
ncbi:hypothetical protein PHYBOEH_004442 [Phytophthora boehmeriae]|uniref:CBS domain-containing protein n=1 Tax=Phytophthora boehmeriae TaxID=109152 RepID=A0A8T1WTB6_9STRA|nr:hypothetical protein PHYBOEH_004442 [Phytophthora boehmeriae]